MTDSRDRRVAPARRFVAFVAVTLLALMGLFAFWWLTYAPVESGLCPAGRPLPPGCAPEARRPTLLMWSGVVTAVYLVLAILTVTARAAWLRVLLTLALVAGIGYGGWLIYQGA